MRKSRPDLVILCPATARHAEYVERVAPHRVHILVEKPFAASVAEADRMIAAAKRHKVFLAINWPLRWYPSHCTAHRLLTEGRIGELEEVHFYDGNRGPLWHTADKIESTPTPARKRQSWFYKRAQGGGSLLDYLGYGTTLGTWYHQGRKPIEVTAVTDLPNGLEVDEHSITIARYACGLSKFETRWGTFTRSVDDSAAAQVRVRAQGNRRHDQQLRCASRPCGCKRAGGRKGKSFPVDRLKPPFQNPIQYFIDCLRRGPRAGRAALARKSAASGSKLSTARC